jgi:hypothetical protein
VHNRTIAQAIADRKAIEIEEGADSGRTFERLGMWWATMKSQFADWRGIIRDRFQSLLPIHPAPYRPHDIEAGR